MNQSIPEVFPVLISTDKTVSVIAPLIIDATEKIIRVTRQLQESGQMSTPFSNNPEKEFQTVVQHTIWLYTSVLSGKEYEFEDFREKLTEQLTMNHEHTAATRFAKVRKISGIDLQHAHTIQAVVEIERQLSALSDNDISRLMLLAATGEEYSKASQTALAV